ncbi:cancer-related nucleoside-triphosphatase [Sceloporus undulatus]|uniref:cancer-related nucleoside-triphosphatase n=1 Tax=Sceloporus undulatus TaxID=8520 RepID=UPI001C4D8CB5|nr:cancer-related nucleoside-triphosphatase [Sceloporus undulatus]XP_042302502.1 cancer-related nucleoside-triphosphatase [Sceloporus undulatus]XP_042302503.1 cancer-related nucleoside-triphosphatase [Sceloporus undulatus]XP_042302504.1 cancer-related nucleoside-triphosphatase [Sceloporus undulatus]XP_042302505.1 cancer-related nucleoside-triphosphatase [Sceloporus undulatus]
MARHVFLTGPPGIGKTTLIQKATEILKSSGLPIDGFYTEEVREGGRRIGFDVVTLSGKRGILSRVGCDLSTARREYRVGQYVVDLASFEQLALPLLRNADLGSSAVKRVCVIDEIGKMELFSQSFIQAVRQMLSGSGIVMLGTIPVPKGKLLGIVEEIRTNKEVKVFTITKENRDNILEDIVTAVQKCLK